MNFSLLRAFVASIALTMKGKRSLTLQSIAPRLQIIMLKRSVKRAKPTSIDRIFWIALARSVAHWRDLLNA